MRTSALDRPADAPPLGRRHRLPILLLAALAWGQMVGCVSAPPIAKVTPHGVIRSEDLGAGMALADEFLAFRSTIVGWLPDTRSGPVDVWIEQRPAPGESAHSHENEWADAYTLTWSNARTPRVHLPADSETDAERRNLIAHELVHALLGPTWSTLPTALEEGLATWVATKIEPRSYQRVTKLLAAAPDRMAHIELSAHLDGTLVALPDPDLTLAIGSVSDASIEEILAYPVGQRLYPEGRAAKLRLYGIGLALVESIIERHGIEGLHGLCLRAQREGLEHIETGWILQAAGATSPAGRRAALRPALRPEDGLWLVDHRDLWTRLARCYHALQIGGSPLGASADDFVAALELQIGVDRIPPTSWRELSVYPQLRAELFEVLSADWPGHARRNHLR